MGTAVSERETTKEEFASVLERLRRLPEAGRARLHGAFAQALLEDTFEVPTPRGPMSFVLLGRGTVIRARSVLTKQPATIEWIERFHPNSVFWDVGANVGVYTLYAAMRPDTKVVAFEPAAVNYFLLAANCEANRVDGRVDCLLVGLGRHRAVGRLVVSQFAAAESFTFREKPETDYPTRQAALLVSIDDLVEEFGLPCPNYIKIDVPGLTEDIVAGGARTLRRPEVRELHIEMRERSDTGRRIVQALGDCGLSIVDRPAHADSETTDLTFARTG
jgi:FkbM family methyltransferase